MDQDKNFVEGSISESKVQNILETLAKWRKDMPFLVAMSKEQRSELAKPNDESVNSVIAMAELAESFPSHFSKDVADPAAIRQDVALAKQLQPVAHELGALLQAIEDTLLAARSDAYRNGLVIYAIAKLLKPQIPGMEERLAPLSSRFDRSGRKSKPEA